MIGRTNVSGSGSGGGGGFELTVYGGTTRPEKASHNAIWINTDKEITSHILSATEPANPVEGMAWITIANSGSIKVASPVGGDWITVYPISAKQYIGGAWVDKTAKSYQYGEWVNWIVYLYNLGNQCTDITGGWNATGWSNDDSEITEKLAPFNSDHIKLYYDNSSGYVVYLAGTTNKIDLSGFSSLECTVERTSGAGMNVSVYSSKSGYYNRDYVASLEIDYTKCTVGETYTFSLDISNLTGEYYVLAYPHVSGQNKPNWKLKSVALR